MGSSKTPYFLLHACIVEYDVEPSFSYPPHPFTVSLSGGSVWYGIIFFPQGLIQALVEFNLHEGTPQMRSDVRHLLCLLTKDNEHATVQLNQILIGAVAEAVNSHKSNPAVVSKTSLFV